MNLEKHISKLLYTQDCVIVPEFGAFIAQKKSSVYTNETSEFSPPSKQIVFNVALNQNDGLLIQEVAKNQKLSFENAKEVVETEVQFWKNHLQLNSNLHLGELGTIEKDENGYLKFEAKNHNYLLESFGLESLRAKHILPSEIQQSSSTFWWKAVAIVPVVLGGYLYFAKPQPVSDFVNQQWSGFVSPVVNPTNQASKAIESPIKTIEIEATTYKSEVLTVHDYQVISGSFRKEEEALAQVEKLQKKGYDRAQLTQKKGKFFYVAFQTFHTKEEALEYRKSVQEDFPETWVLSLKE